MHEGDSNVGSPSLFARCSRTATIRWNAGSRPDALVFSLRGSTLRVGRACASSVPSAKWRIGFVEIRSHFATLGRPPSSDSRPTRHSVSTETISGRFAGMKRRRCRVGVASRCTGLVDQSGRSGGATCSSASPGQPSRVIARRRVSMPRQRPCFQRSIPWQKIFSKDAATSMT